MDINDKLSKKEFKSIINFIEENLVVLIRHQLIDNNKLKDFSESLVKLGSLATKSIFYKFYT